MDLAPPAVEEERRIPEPPETPPYEPSRPEVEKEVKADLSFQKTRGNAKTAALNAALRAVDRVEAHIQANPQAVIPFDPEAVRLEVQAADPAEYGRVIEKALKNIPTHEGDSPFRDIDRIGVLREVEDAVGAYLKLQRQPEALKVSRNIAGKDIPMLENRLKNIDAQQKAIDEKLSMTATERQAGELREMKRFLRTQADGVSSRLAKARGILPQKQVPAGAPEPPGLEDDIRANAAAAGKTPEQYNLAIVGALRRLEETAGLDIGDLFKNVPFSVAVRSVLPILDPSGKVMSEAAQMLLDRRKPSEEPQAKSEGAAKVDDSQSRLMEAEIREKQAMRRALFRQINGDQENHTWLSAIAFVLLSVVIGFDRAVRVWGRASQKGNLKPQLEEMNRSIMEDLQILRMRKDEEREIRKAAMERVTKTGDEDKRFERDLYKMFINHQLIQSRAAAKASDPNKAIIKRLEGAYNRTMKFAQDSLKILSDPYQSDQAKKEAQIRYQWMIQKAEKIDEDIMNLGENPEAASPESEGEEE